MITQWAIDNAGQTTAAISNYSPPAILKFGGGPNVFKRGYIAMPYTTNYKSFWIFGFPKKSKHFQFFS